VSAFVRPTSVIGICEHSRHGDNIFNTCFDYSSFVQLTNNFALYPNITFKFPGVQVCTAPSERGVCFFFQGGPQINLNGR
jgi:hypothetical protein